MTQYDEYYKTGTYRICASVRPKYDSHEFSNKEYVRLQVCGKRFETWSPTQNAEPFAQCFECAHPKLKKKRNKRGSSDRPSARPDRQAGEAA